MIEINNIEDAFGFYTAQLYLVYDHTDDDGYEVLALQSIGIANGPGSNPNNDSIWTIIERETIEITSADIS